MHIHILRKLDVSLAAFQNDDIHVIFKELLDDSLEGFSEKMWRTKTETYMKKTKTNSPHVGVFMQTVLCPNHANTLQHNVSQNVSHLLASCVIKMVDIFVLVWEPLVYIRSCWIWPERLNFHGYSLLCSCQLSWSIQKQEQAHTAC